MTISEYIKNISKRFKTGISREHSYRGDLQNLLEGMLNNVMVTNEPARIACGAPDFILTHKAIPVGYMEAKDIGEPLTGRKHREQFNRYRESLTNIIFTDYLDFHFYRDGEFVISVRLAEIAGDSIRAIPGSEETFRLMINDFASHSLQTIKSASKLSKMMAAKARLLSEIIENALLDDERRPGSDTSLRSQLSAFQNVLMHDIDEKEFADIYAQTIAYGMFAARLHDTTLETFSRFEAARLIPKSNPFLRRLFQYIAGYDLDERIDWVVDALADTFRATDVEGLLSNFGKSTQQTDPIIHFYETFLAEFDPKLRKSRGVWYTPEPVVNFIVRAVDDILKDEFGLKDGLADTSKTKIKIKVPTHDKRFKQGIVEEEREVHKVQILDPAVGTGTFLAEVIKQIHSKFEGQQGIWPDYVENHLIPRLNGFEILMASYAMAHLKLDLLLKETGFDRETNQRFRVYLTNSLQEHHPDTGTLFAGWLSDEANEANHIKRDTPVMVVLGNPPYNANSQNTGDWIMNLMEDYKKEPGGKEKLKERNPKALNDDYVKFIRFAQYFIEKNGEGVLAYINPHSYLNNPTFRGMRWSLLNYFDKIYVIDLHGNSKINETSPNGEKDINVFDIQLGVSINLFIKHKSNNSEVAEVNHFDLFGSRENKYDFLKNNDLKSTSFEKLSLNEPMFFMVKRDIQAFDEYQQGVSINKLFIISGMGIATGNDNQFISFEAESLQKFGDSAKIQSISYRLFDERYIYNDYSVIERGREKLMYHMLNKDNLGLFSLKRARKNFSNKFSIISRIVDKSYVSTLDNGYLFPLYLYDDNNQQTLDGTPERKPNLNLKIVKKIAEGLGLKFTPEKEGQEGTFAPIDILDYIYAILHSPTYRETYKEFLKIDFPRVPYPDDSEQFWNLVKLGGELRQLHLMEHPVLDEFITTYPKAGSNTISNRLTKRDPGFVPDDNNKKIGKVKINDDQYFGNVPLKAWEFYIGGYQPAEKWLKDRRGRTLSMEEIQHYQRIIVALMETERLMREIDVVYFKPIKEGTS